MTSLHHLIGVLLAITALLPVPAVAGMVLAPDDFVTPAGTAVQGSGVEACAIIPTRNRSGQALAATFADLPAGKYRLAARLAAPPFGREPTTVTCNVDAPGAARQSRRLTGPEFPQDGTPLGLAFTVVLPRPGTVAVELRWDGNRERLLKLPEAGAASPAVEAVDEIEPLEAEPQSAASDFVTMELPFLRVYALALNRLDRGLALTRARADKVLYAPDEAGHVTVTLCNFTDLEQSGVLRLQLVHDVGEPRGATGVPVQVAAGETVAVELPFNAARQQFGCLAEVLLEQAGTVADRESDVFSVSDSLWAVGLGGATPISGHSALVDPGGIPQWVEALRDDHVNWWEKMFWPPDDWGDMTPDTAEWISGQSARWENAANIKAFIAALKPHGIRSITYGKHVAMGPSGWELCRRRPGWFYQNARGQPAGRFHTLDLHHWNDFAYHQDQSGRFSHATFISTWWAVSPDLRRVDTVDWGIRELLESTREFGWDGVRFDGHWTAGNDALSTWNMQRLKQALWADHPEFEFGFNYSWSHGYQTSHLNSVGMVTMDHEYRESMAGGGMHMQEAIRGFHYAASRGYESWREYATAEAKAALGVHRHGGHYYFIYGLDQLKPNTALYKFVLGTMAGVHPVYGAQRMAPGCADWGRFLTRWSALLWDPQLAQVDPGDGIDVQSSRPLWWRHWVRERVADTTTRQLVLHLLNPPLDDAIAAEDDLPPPPALETVVRVRAPSSQQLRRVYSLEPMHRLDAVQLEAVSRDGWLEVTPGRVDVWRLIVFEFAGQFDLPPAVPRFTEEPAADEVAAGRELATGAAGLDPMRPPVMLADNDQLFETDSGFNSVPALATRDAAAINGRAQYRPADQTSVYIGRTWMGPLAPGKYLARLRIRLEDLGSNSVSQSMGMRMLFHNVWDYNVGFGTDPDQFPPERRLIADNAYHYYEIPFEMPVAGAPCLIGGAYTPAPDTSRFYLDHIVLRQLEAYTDAKLLAADKTEMPPGLVPGGAAGIDLLLVKGWTWETFDVAAAAAAIAGGAKVAERWSNTGEADKFPQSYAEVYGYDSVVLVNVGATGLGYGGRRALRDFVMAGGQLVILGGSYTLGQGNFDDTFLAELVPLTLAAGDVVRGDPAPVLRAVPESRLCRDLPAAIWSAQPCVYWYHQLQPQATATVHLLAGDAPVVVSAGVGRGRVVVVGLTALGEPRQAGEVPFWAWDGWQALLAKILSRPASPD